MFFRSRAALVVLVCSIVHSSTTRARADDEEIERRFQLRVGSRVRLDLVKGWKAWVSPEMRTDGFDPDRYLLELGIKYEPVKYIALRTEFRSDVDESGYDRGYRPGGSVKGSLPLGDFEPSLRFLYTYDFGTFRDERHRFRYQGKIDYDLPNMPLEAAAAAEVFQRLDDRGVYKMRYSISFDYEIEKTKKVGHGVYAGYMFDYFLDKLRDVLILEFGYKIAFE